MREAGKRCGLRDSAAMSLKRRIAADLLEFFGEDVIRRLLDGTRPGWEIGPADVAGTAPVPCGMLPGCR